MRSYCRSYNLEAALIYALANPFHHFPNIYFARTIRHAESSCPTGCVFVGRDDPGTPRRVDFDKISGYKRTRYFCIMRFAFALALGNCVYGALACACAAIEAGVCVDLEFAVALCNSVHRAYTCACAAGDAVVTNFKSHNNPSYSPCPLSTTGG